MEEAASLRAALAAAELQATDAAAAAEDAWFSERLEMRREIETLLAENTALKYEVAHPGFVLPPAGGGFREGADTKAGRRGERRSSAGGEAGSQHHSRARASVPSAPRASTVSTSLKEWSVPLEKHLAGGRGAGAERHQRESPPPQQQQPRASAELGNAAGGFTPLMAGTVMLRKSPAGKDVLGWR